MPVLTTQERFRRTVRREWSFVRRNLRRFGVPESCADDARQMVFLTFSARLAEVHVESERAFLVGTCFRIAANVRRGLSRSKEVTGLSIDTPAPNDPETLLHCKRCRQAFDRALAALPAEQRVVFFHFVVEGLTLPEIAASLEIPAGTAASRLRRARAQLKGWARKQTFAKQLTAD